MTVVFVVKDEGGQAGDEMMTWVKSGGHDWSNIYRRCHETITAAHKKLSPNVREYVYLIDCVFTYLLLFSFSEFGELFTGVSSHFTKVRN